MVPLICESSTVVLPWYWVELVTLAYHITAFRKYPESRTPNWRTNTHYEGKYKYSAAVVNNEEGVE